MAFTGTLTNINAAVGILTYKPDEDFNTRQHAELLTVTVYQSASSEAKVSLSDGPIYRFPSSRIDL